MRGRPRQPKIAVSGAVALDQLAVHDGADAPLVELGHAEVKLADVEPLENRHLAAERSGSMGWSRTPRSITTAPPISPRSSGAHRLPLQSEHRGPRRYSHRPRLRR